VLAPPCVPCPWLTSPSVLTGLIPRPPACTSIACFGPRGRYAARVRTRRTCSRHRPAAGALPFGPGGCGHRRPLPPSGGRSSGHARGHDHDAGVPCPLTGDAWACIQATQSRVINGTRCLSRCAELMQGRLELVAGFDAERKALGRWWSTVLGLLDSCALADRSLGDKAVRRRPPRQVRLRLRPRRMPGSLGPDAEPPCTPSNSRYSASRSLRRPSSTSDVPLGAHLHRRCRADGPLPTCRGLQVCAAHTTRPRDTSNPPRPCAPVDESAQPSEHHIARSGGIDRNTGIRGPASDGSGG
jgi:hypothetical protein